MKSSPITKIIDGYAKSLTTGHCVVEYAGEQ